MKNALIVDDSKVVRRFARNILEGIGFACQEAGDGLQALAACRASMPDLILLDWEMPILDGLGFATTLRAEPGGDAPKILFCDEPTGNLDGATAAVVTELIFGLNHERGTTLVMVTHDLELAKQCGRVLRLKDGRVVG